MIATTIIQLITGAIGSVGFGILFHMKKKYLPLAAVGGFLSWLVFLLVNLVTQGAVNALLLWGVGPLGNLYSTGIAYWLLYVPMELVVLAVEIVAFRKLLREKEKLSATIYAIVANLFSWLLGGAMLTYLPI